MHEEELLYALALQHTKGIGDIYAKKLISHCGSAKSVLLARKNLIEKIDGIGTMTIRHLFDGKNLKKAEKELDYLRKNDIKPWYFFDGDYPERLKHCIDSPILFFTKGEVDFTAPRVLSIVGTRQMTPYGKENCNNLIDELAPYSPVIISGFAYGVDICAHRAAIRNNLQTIGVLAHGFEEIYPKTHAPYMDKMMKHGGFISEFWHDDELIKENFIKRNRIVAGLSEATVIIESADKGGSLVTADIANSYNRDVFAIPGRITDTFSQGCNGLIKQHKATILNSASELIELLNWDQTEVPVKSIQKELFVELNNEEQQLFSHLESNGKSMLDQIALHCQFTIQKTSTVLFSLEMKGLVRPLPGKWYELI